MAVIWVMFYLIIDELGDADRTRLQEEREGVQRSYIKEKLGYERIKLTQHR